MKVMARVRRATAGAAVAWALSALAGCGGSDPGSSRAALGDGGREAAPGGTYGASACGQCVESACSAELAECSSDPGCAARWSCVRQCPTSAEGNVELTCVSACPAASGTGKTLFDALDGCRNVAPCASCGAASPADASTDGGDARPGADGGSSDAGVTSPILTQACPASTDPNVCYRCEDTHCCDTYAACTNDPACKAFTTCMKACTVGDYGTCIAGCDAKVPGGYALFASRMACITVLCSEPCAGKPPSACEQCVNEKCANAYVTCESNESCSRLGLCNENCTADACRQTCLARFPDGRADFEALAACTDNLCVDSCG